MPTSPFTGSAEHPVTFHTAANGLFAGFRQEWISGSDPESGAMFTLTSGAGCGSRYLLLTVTIPATDGGTPVTTYEAVDVCELVEARVTAILADASR